MKKRIYFFMTSIFVLLITFFNCQQSGISSGRGGGGGGGGSDSHPGNIWTKLLGVAGAQTNALGITSDSSTNVYTTGYTFGDLDGQTLTGGRDLFVVKYDSNGNKQWTRLLGVAGADTEANNITSDSSGNVYTTGYTKGNLDGQTLTGTQDLFVVKYDANGNKFWTRLLGVAGAQTNALGITSDLSANIYTTGYTNGNLDGQTKTGNYDLFVVKYDSNGNKLWTRLLGVTGVNTAANGITSDSNANVYTTGYTFGDLDGQTLTGGRDLFVVKYDSNGIKQWTKLLGVAWAETVANGITSDSSANVYTTGYTDGNLDGQTKTGTQDLFVVKYDSNGNKLWTRLLGDAGADTLAHGITSDSTGNVYTTGFTNGNLDGQTLTGVDDLFIVKYNSNGVN